MLNDEQKMEEIEKMKDLVTDRVSIPRKDGRKVLLKYFRDKAGNVLIIVSAPEGREEKYFISGDQRCVDKDEEWGRICWDIENDFNIKIVHYDLSLLDPDDEDETLVKSDYVFDDWGFYKSVDDPIEDCPRYFGYKYASES